jgi:hypothetical protein
MRGPSNDAGQDGVDADVVRAEFLGEALRQADHAPLGGGIRSAKGVSEPPGGRRKIDDGAAARIFKHRYAVVRAQELAGEADVNRPSPVLRPDLLDAAGRSCDARVVDKRVQSAERGFDVGKESRHIDIRRHVGFGGGRVRMHLAEVRQEFVRHIADMDFRAASYQEIGGRPADARGAGSDEDPQSGGESKDIGRLRHGIGPEIMCASREAS